MSLSNYDMSPVKELIKVLNGGVEFYKEAKEELSDNTLATIFNKMITEKTRAISELQTYVLIDEGEIEDDSDLIVTMREKYTKLLTVVRADKEHTYLDQLEEVEDRVLDKLSDAMEASLPEPCNIALSQIQIRMQACHDEMKALQQASA
ncbi:PA2169 family four-helix-bundle protein [Thalassotalea sp. 1_MG-2023]|uniref:PA2169 family four-helix-bundle protein n=1 Tax=Thalassotalea sp. 1_MG-2023 TaxID=3062680 RepID=UPI0026E39CF8|nr:PA2169 family four-helix-bundle protein [Thalassotalea sp. 1_MG-2023]MDO6428606.1 PA2169 family four-helix-bundle protein [Thalassotalea sp. 1_MG-2023]